MTSQLGVVVGKLRVTQLWEEGGEGYAALSPAFGPNNRHLSETTFTWPVSKAMLNHIRLGTELWVEAPEEIFADD